MKIGELRRHSLSDPHGRAEYVRLDTCAYDGEETRRHEAAWRMPATVAERIVDPESQTLR